MLNNQWAFDTAKQNVEKYYQVVGVLEELNTTLDVLEGQIPQFFKRAKITYEQHLLGKHSLVYYTVHRMNTIKLRKLTLNSNFPFRYL